MNNIDKSIPAFNIGTVSKMLGVSEETLRLYERKGLILTKKNDGHQRRYSQSDIERLKCIRDAITEYKISIEGIRRLQSMIPCWDYVKCPMHQRSKCPAYSSPAAGCWTYKHRENACADRDCRTCQVYKLSSDCEKIKSLILHKATSVSISEGQVI
ncbi:MAG: MerR family transcriptional regulator [Bacteroidota bacterium]